MFSRYVLCDYVGAALGDAIHEKLEDRTFSGHLPPCIGVVAFGRSLGECEDELRSTLEDWILVGLRLKHPLPVVNGIDLNKEPVRESVDAL